MEKNSINADAGSIYIKDNDSLSISYTQTDTLQKGQAEGEKQPYLNFTLPIDQTSIAGYVASKGEPLNIPDVTEIDSNAPYAHKKSFDQKTGYQNRSNLTVPLKTIRGDVLGVLQIFNAQDEDDQIIQFSQEDERMMLHFASTATGSPDAVINAAAPTTSPSRMSSSEQAASSITSMPARATAARIVCPIDIPTAGLATAREALWPPGGNPIR